jgi:hypothetical protein
VLRDGNEGSAKHLVYTRDKLDSFLPNDRKTKERVAEELRLPNIGKISTFMKNNLTDTLEHLIRTNVFYQVHQWRCEYCGHINSRNFDVMKNKNSCEVCNLEYCAPIDLEWTYQLNDFVYRSLVKQTGLPVLWTLGFLQDKTSQSFWYLPEVDLYEKFDDPEKKKEIDILCVANNKFYAIEVKMSVSQLTKPESVSSFIEKINMIRPDVAMLAFERYCEEEKDIEATKAFLLKVSDEIKSAIGPYIEMSTIVAYDIKGFNEYPVDLGWWGSRTDSVR